MFKLKGKETENRFLVQSNGRVRSALSSYVKIQTASGGRDSISRSVHLCYRGHGCHPVSAGLVVLI